MEFNDFGKIEIVPKAERKKAPILHGSIQNMLYEIALYELRDRGIADEALVKLLEIKKAIGG